MIYKLFRGPLLTFSIQMESKDLFSNVDFSMSKFSHFQSKFKAESFFKPLARSLNFSVFNSSRTQRLFHFFGIKVFEVILVQTEGKRYFLRGSTFMKSIFFLHWEQLFEIV